MVVSISDRVDQLQEELIPKLPDDALETIQDTTKELVESGISESAVGSGDPAPDVQLPISAGDKKGEHWTLSLALETGPVVLSFYRGGW